VSFSHLHAIWAASKAYQLHYIHNPWT